MILPNMISLLVPCMSGLVPVGSRDDWRGYDAESNDFIPLKRWREGLVGVEQGRWNSCSGATAGKDMYNC
jgi:hypothetical protein